MVTETLTRAQGDQTMAIIGMVRTEEARTYDSHAGYHQFHAEETQETHGSFEVFFLDRWPDGDSRSADWPELMPGWYWWACSPGCLPDGEPSGPFAYSAQAHEDADEWAHEYDPDFNADGTRI